jgi:hypothetical protein
MPLPMLRPQRHRTGVWRLRLAVPRDLRDACYRLYGARYELIANLHTRDHREARLRAASAEDMLRQKLEVARKHTAGMPARLSDRQIAALAGMVCGRELPALADVERIADFVGHRDACRIDKADAVKWKTELQCKGRHAGTIRHIMSCCRGLWGWGIVTGCCRARTSGTV